ncbi:MAG: sulfatase, partial [Planctomycetota bacterium]
MIIRFACLFLFLAISALTDQRAVRADVRPNILFILTDDQGWPSLESYGGDLVPTPNLERLAADGMRLTDAYVMPQCTPTRAALLTGQHTAKNQMWHVIGWYGTPRAPIAEPMYRLNLQPQQCRLPRWLQQNGYRTGMGGKWHLTNNQHGYYTILRQKSGPLFGFDHVAPPGKGSQNDGDKWVDHLTDDACDFIRRNRDRPWFYYLSHHTLHGKVSAPRPLIDKYSQSGAPKVGMHNATYLAAIEHLDNSVGRLLKTLDETRTADNTLVVFLADNGGVDTQYNLPAWSDDPLDGSRPLSIKEQQYENAPLREGKGSAYEGGIRVPCIVRWPGVIDRGRVETTPVHIVDWLPTLCSAAGCPTKTDEDGEDLTPLFRSKTTSEAISNRSLYWYLPLYDLRWAATPCAVIRRGPWKLIHYFGDSFDKTHQYRIGERSELFNLQEDIGESTDLSLAKPALTAELRSELVQWIQRCSAVVPESNSHNDPEQRLAETREVPAWKLPVHVHPQNA